MKVALIGADGQLGTDLNEVLTGNHEVYRLLYPDFDITRTESTELTLKSLQTDIVINTAAYNLVDQAEEDPCDAFRLNTMAVRRLALICRELKIPLVHFSSDYIFGDDHSVPCVESDPPNPLSVYGMSKLAGEYFVRNIAPKHYVIRTCGLFGKAGSLGKGTNFVESIISSRREGKPLRVVNDQIVTPTSTFELAERVAEIILSGEFGLYHMTNEGKCSWFEFAKGIFEILGEQAEIEPVTSRELGARARRPRFSVLDNRKASEIGITEFSHWREALRNYLIRKGHLPGIG